MVKAISWFLLHTDTTFCCRASISANTKRKKVVLNTFTKLWKVKEESLANEISRKLPKDKHSNLYHHIIDMEQKDFL